jgi:hypothetical protein
MRSGCGDVVEWSITINVSHTLPSAPSLVAETGCDMSTVELRPGPWRELGWGGFEEPGPQTESSIERGFRLRGPVDDEYGRSESLDPDNVGDIADEGTGHRG